MKRVGMMLYATTRFKIYNNIKRFLSFIKNGMFIYRFILLICKLFLL